MTNKVLFLMICVFSTFFKATPTSIEKQAQDAMLYFIDELERDPILTHDEQLKKVQEFKIFAERLSPEVASFLTQLLLAECHIRVVEMIQHAGLDAWEIKCALADYDQAVREVKKMDVETARQMLFFVAELKLHRQYVYEFGLALGCPEKQLLRHDLCKLNPMQFEGYVRYFRGGKQEEDKLGYLAAWHEHQHEEHHHECYNQECFDFDTFPQERLRANMLEAVADLLAATKQRGGTTLTDWLLNDFPKKNPHPRLIPYLEEALIKAHGFYQECEIKGDRSHLFSGLPCWNDKIAELFSKLRTT